MAAKQMSFLPEDYVERRIERRTNLICLSLFAVVLTCVVGAYAATSRHRSEVRANRELVNKSYAEAAKRIEQLEQLQNRKQEMLRKAQVTATLIEPVPRTFLLAELVNRMPATLSLIELKLVTKADTTRVLAPKADTSKSALANKSGTDATKAEPPPPPKNVVTVEMVGVAPTDVQVAQFMSQLSQSKLVADVNLVFSEEAQIEGAAMRKFRIDMSLAENADVRLIEPLLVPRKTRLNPLKPAEAAILPGGGPPPIETANHPAGEN
jgi:Tfp pilus assembly protein PilN